MVWVVGESADVYELVSQKGEGFDMEGVTKQKASYFLIVFRHTFIVVNQSLFSILSITQFVRVALSPSQLQTDLPSRWSTTACISGCWT